jgi:hypothetical protein
VARASLLAVVLCSSLLVPPAVHAADARHGAPAGRVVAPLSRTERNALASRELVARPLRFERGSGGSYVGGVSYQVVRADPHDVLAALANVETLPHALPSTLDATLVSREGRRARVELVQGRAPFVARYTVVLEQAADGNSIRFWLDPTRPHDIRDVWGFFRVERFGSDKTLVTVAAALDLGPGLTRALFEDRVQRMILKAPSRIRSYVEPLALSSAK